MPRKSVLQISKKGLALKVLSKLLYAIIGMDTDNEELIDLHKRLLNEFISIRETDAGDVHFDMAEIPWERLLNKAAAAIPTLKILISPEQRFSAHELQYICAMLCGLTGKEYEIITGFKSQYNLSWSIRHKLGIPSKTTNLRNYLQELQYYGSYESPSESAQK